MMEVHSEATQHSNIGYPSYIRQQEGSIHDAGGQRYVICFTMKFMRRQP
jgi:hypothetical protein